MPTPEELEKYKEEFEKYKKLVLDADARVRHYGSSDRGQHALKRQQDTYGKNVDFHKHCNMLIKLEFAKPVAKRDNSLIIDVSAFIKEQTREVIPEDINKQLPKIIAQVHVNRIDKIIALESNGAPITATMNDELNAIKTSLTALDQQVRDNNPYKQELGKLIATKRKANRGGQDTTELEKQLTECKKNSQEYLTSNKITLDAVDAVITQRGDVLDNAQAIKQALCTIHKIPVSKPELTFEVIEKVNKEHEAEIAALKESVKIQSTRSEEQTAKEARLETAKGNLEKTTKVLAPFKKVHDLKVKYQKLLVAHKTLYNDKKNSTSQEDKVRLHESAKQVIALKERLRKEYGVGKHELNEMRKEYGKKMDIMERAGAKVTAMQHSASAVAKTVATNMRQRLSKVVTRKSTGTRATGGRGQGSGMSM